MIKRAPRIVVVAALAAALCACAPGARSSSGLPCNDDDECGPVERCLAGACSYTGRSPDPVVAPVADAGTSLDDAGLSLDDAGEPDGGGTALEVDGGPDPVCGDGVVQSGEDCDDGNTVDDGNGCDEECRKSAVCGNGVVEELYESCDPGAESCCADDCQGPASADTVCREAGDGCDAAERCDGDSYGCPADEALANGESCVECGQDGCACVEGACVAAGRVGPMSDAYLGTNSPYPYDPNASTCHMHGDEGAGRFTVGTWQDGEEVRGVLELLVPTLNVAYAQLRFEVGSFPGLEGQDGPGDFDIAVHAIDANGTAGTSDCARESRGEVLRFSTQGLAPGQTLTADVTDALAGSLGFTAFRFEPVTDPGYHTGVTFEGFSLVYVTP